MSNVTLSICGRTFTVACAEGEEEHIGDLGRMIDSRLADLGEGAGQNEVRMLLYASLVLADDLVEARKAAEQAPTAPAHAGPSLSPEMARRVEAIAATLENLATHLES